MTKLDAVVCGRRGFGRSSIVESGRVLRFGWWRFLCAFLSIAVTIVSAGIIIVSSTLVPFTLFGINMPKSAFPAVFLVGLLSLGLAPTPAVAGPFTDDLSKCLVSKTTPDDKIVLVRWIFATMALNPSVGEMASVSEVKRVDVTKQAAALFETLLTDRCLPEAQKASKYEGSTAFEASFRVLGEIAAAGLFSDPKVREASSQIAKYLDGKKLESAFGGGAK